MLTLFESLESINKNPIINGRMHDKMYDDTATSGQRTRNALIRYGLPVLGVGAGLGMHYDTIQDAPLSAVSDIGKLGLTGGALGYIGGTIDKRTTAFKNNKDKMPTGREITRDVAEFEKRSKESSTDNDKRRDMYIAMGLPFAGGLIGGASALGLHMLPTIDNSPPGGYVPGTAGLAALGGLTGAIAAGPVLNRRQMDRINNKK